MGTDPGNPLSRTLSSSPAQLDLRWNGTSGLLKISGDWHRTGAPIETGRLLKDCPTHGVIALDCSDLGRWDSSLPAFIVALEGELQSRSGKLSTDNLPAATRRLLTLVRTPVAATPQPQHRANVLERIGRGAARAIERTIAWFGLAGAAGAAMVRWLLGRARVAWADIVEQIEECGPRSLPIVTLLSFLIGGITAFVGVVQLRMFGAEIYVADLVAMGMLLEMGALMTGVIMAGRAGAAFAAALGTMQTNEEIDALQTLGLDPVEFLVMPRMLALALMMPLLTIYADLLGILGGAFVGMTMLDISPASYLTQTANAVHLSDAVKGLIKSLTFGVLIGFAGCLRGLECGRNARAVGQATTSAVVTAIVLIVLADALLTVLFFIADGML